MAKRQFYRTESSTICTHVKWSDRREMLPRRVVVNWCAHDASPLRREAALAGGKLTCGSDLEKYPILDKL